MKKKISSKSDSSPSFFSSEDLEGFIVRHSNLLGKDERENEERSLTNDSVYPTVRFHIAMNRTRRRLLLQTVLDRIFLRQGFYLYLAEYIILEELYSSIIENDSKENLKETTVKLYAEMLKLTYWILKNLSIRTKIEIRKGTDFSKDDVLGTIEKEFQVFRISSQRSYESRVNTYYPERIVSFTVGVPLISKARNSSTPYSSYTKGYGESHPKKLQTPIDYEIDGEDIYNFEETQSLEPRLDFTVSGDEEQSNGNIGDSDG